MKMRPCFQLLIFMIIACFLVSCSKQASNIAEEAPPPAEVIHESNEALVKVQHPERYELFTAGEHDSESTLSVTGVVSPDVTRQVPVISLVSGRVVQLRVKLGDRVEKGQFLMQIRSSDIAGAFSDYRKSAVDEKLARIQYQRAKRLHEAGVIALNDLQVAQDVEDKAKVDLETTKARLKTLGASVKSPSSLVNVYAPVSGVITDEQVTLSSAVQAFSSPNPLTISDLSHVWILCDVYENDMHFVQVGQYADVRLNAYPDKIWTAQIVNIAPILDPSIRSVKVRLELLNPGLMRVGMFATAKFYGKTKVKYAVVPASAVLHLYDRDWVYVPLENGEFKRIEVTVGEMVGPNMQEIFSGILPGQQVAAKALVLENTNSEP